MTQTVPPSITPSPVAPDRADRATFSPRATAWADWVKNHAVAEIAAVATNVYNNAVDAFNNAVDAFNSATTALGSANAASDSAAAAAISESAAAASALEAAGLVESYQGALAADPTLDKDGNPLAAGDWYINTATGFVRAYNGSAWVQGISVVAGVSSLNGQTGDLTIQGTPDFILMSQGVI